MSDLCFSLFASLSKNVSHNPNTKHKTKSNSYNKVESEQANMKKKEKKEKEEGETTAEDEVFTSTTSSTTPPSFVLLPTTKLGQIGFFIFFLFFSFFFIFACSNSTLL